jgi:hypothetical protein
MRGPGPLLLTLLAFAGCTPYAYTSYNSLEELPQAERAHFAEVDGYYLGKAKEQAAFALNCQEVRALVISKRPAQVGDREPGGRVYAVEHAERATTIGVEGCGQRATYEILCGPYELYADTKGGGCDVIPSTVALRVQSANNQAQVEIDRAAAAAAAAQQQQQQQLQMQLSTQGKK